MTMTDQTQTAVVNGESGQFEIPIDQIHVPEDNPRRTIDTSSTSFLELVASIQQRGVRVPVELRPRTESDGGGYELVWGARRVAASKQAGKTTVPAVLCSFTDPRERHIDRLIENLHREDLTVIEEAIGYQQAIKDGWTQVQLAEALGIKQPRISKRLALLKLPQRAQDLVDDRTLSLEEAAELVQLTRLPAKQTAEVFERVYAGQYAPSGEEGSIAELARAQVKEHERGIKRARLAKDLKASGAKVVPWPDGGFAGAAERVLVDQDHRCVGFEHLAIDDAGHGLSAAEHADQPCHAAMVCPDHNQVSWVCIDFASHQPPAPPAEPDTPAQPAAVQEQQDEGQQGEQQEAEQSPQAADTAEGDSTPAETPAVVQEPEAAASTPEAPADSEATGAPTPSTPEPDPEEARAQEEQRLAREQRAAHKKALTQAATLREEAIGALLQRKPNQKELLRLLGYQLTHNGNPEQLVLGCQWLGVDGKPDPWGATSYWQGLIDHLKDNPTDAGRVALAMILADVEVGLRGETLDWGNHKVGQHMAYLGAHGYEVNDAERAEMTNQVPGAS